MNNFVTPMVKAVMAAADLGPQITRLTVIAGHGPAKARQQNLAEAIKLTMQLLGHLELAQIAARRRDGEAA
jgi:hypothetical protein